MFDGKQRRAYFGSGSNHTLKKRRDDYKPSRTEQSLIHSVPTEARGFIASVQSCFTRNQSRYAYWNGFQGLAPILSQDTRNNAYNVSVSRTVSPTHQRRDFCFSLHKRDAFYQKASFVFIQQGGVFVNTEGTEVTGGKRIPVPNGIPRLVHHLIQAKTSKCLEHGGVGVGLEK